MKNNTCVNIDECDLDPGHTLINRNLTFPLNYSYPCEIANACNATVSYCVDSFGSYDCPCLDGFEMSPYGFCDNIDECQKRNECPLMSRCVDQFGYYECQCPAGYDSLKAKGSQIKGTECRDIDECADRTNYCHFSAPYCENSEGSYVCECDPGYEYKLDKGEDMSKNGECLDLNECELGTSTCDHHCENKIPHQRPSGTVSLTSFDL